MVVLSLEEVNDDGAPCIELIIPRGKLVGILYVDPAHGYRPLKLIQQYEGIIQVQHEISYRDDAAGGVSKWVSSNYHSGELRESYSGKTKTVSINQPLDEKLFKLQFPIGTQITEEKARTRKLLYSRGRRAPERDFRKRVWQASNRSCYVSQPTSPSTTATSAVSISSMW
jgi:hypothetical protein